MTQEDLELPAGFGAHDGFTQKYVTKKLKKADDEFDIRILPMMKSLLNITDFGLDWKLHFGWNGKGIKDPTKPQYHPFLCIQEKARGGLVTTECPACTYMDPYVTRLASARLDMKTQVDALREKGKAKGIPETAINAKVAELKTKLLNAMKPDADWCYNHGRDGKFRIPFIDRQGQFGIFLAPYGVVQDLRKEMAELRKRVYPGTDIKIQPNGRKGVWFKITRTGPASRDSDKASPCKIVRDDGAEVLDFHVISNEQLQQAQDRIPDLVALRDENRISVEQMEALVALDKAGGGSPDPIAVDAIFAAAKAKDKDVSTVPVDDDWDKPVAGTSATTEPVVEKDFTGAVATGASVAEPAKAAETPKAEVKPEVKEEPKAEAAPEDFDDLWK